MLQRLFPPHFSPLQAGVLAAVCAGLSFAMWAWHLEQQDLTQQRAQVAGLANDHAHSLQRSIESALSANSTLVALVRQGQGQVDHFESIGQQLLPFYPGIVAMGLAPNGIVQKVVPLRGNEVLLGFNQLTDRIQGAESTLARDSGQLTLAGPLPLVQGGIGVVGRQPVYLDTESGGRRFWGLTHVTIRMADVLAAANLPDLAKRGYQYRLWRTLPSTGQRQDISVSNPPPGPHPVEQALSLPNGQWFLAVTPAQGWGNPARLAQRTLLGLLFALLAGYVVRLLLQLKVHERDLESLVQIRTAEIFSTQQQLQATMDAIPDMLLELDDGGRFLSIDHAHAHVLAIPAAKLIGRHFWDVLTETNARSLAAVLEQAREHGSATGPPLCLDIPVQGLTWFELSVARKAATSNSAPGYVLLARDITERKASQETLLLTAQAFDQSSEAILILDAQRRTVRVNQAFSRITGFSIEQALGQPVDWFIANAHEGGFGLLCQHVEHQGYWEGETWGQRADQSTYPQWLSLSCVRDANTTITHHIAILRDITQQRAIQEKIEHMARFDHLTGLPNRVFLAEQASKHITQHHSSQGDLAVVFLDLDHFKNVNDSLGHRVGDALLVILAQRLQSVVREQDTVSRLGGDEFLLLLPNTEAQMAARITTDLLRTLAQPFQVDGHELSTTVSIGIAMFPTDGDNFDTLYQRADAAMYRAKRSGRNQYSFFTADLEASSARTLLLENALHRAQERQQFELHYQPQVSLQTGQIVGAEALLRWNHPQLGPISPAEFIPIAENSGLIVAIGEWVLATAIRDAKRWLEEGIGLKTVSVNLSAVQFRHPHLLEMVSRCLDDAQLPGHRLELELTEGTAVDDPVAALSVMTQLHQQGAHLSMDDFGTGYSSLSQLKRFPLGKLKIDQSFVRDVSEDANDRAIITAIIHMAKALGMRTTAEGVETEAQRAFLLEQGCDEGQGYLFSRPLPLATFEVLLRTPRPSNPL